MGLAEFTVRHQLVLQHQPSGLFGGDAHLHAALPGERIDDGNDAVIPRAQTLAETRRHRRDWPSPGNLAVRKNAWWAREK